MQPMTIRQQLQSTLLKINLQIDVIENHAARMSIAANEMLNKDGKYAMVDLLVAKANILNALVTLEATERIRNVGHESRPDNQGRHAPR